ncbi:poly polymerase catalytic domain-containing protein [Lasiosphaeria miniovina]|uniref:Poly [ADP-ribose] polymerase n=1 Tax=Lasiosphaeria miniovina TaxID=1954250 RepID=A0AA40B7G7_9PEZI|nr:poly polymerase catalytic domain-containing protein [Lasiosphaeria miniovina]KAK0728783.1 poly polymerase catalytic domain-containing protein [Lasiosphaeria miniovina]
MPPKRAKKVAAPAKPALDGCKIALSGNFPGTPQAALRLKAEAVGATVTNTVTDDTTHLIATEGDFNKPSVKVAKAQTLGIPIVGLEWLSLSDQNNARQPENNFVLGASAKSGADQPDDAKSTSSQPNSTKATANNSRKRADPPANVVDDQPKTKKARGRKAATEAVDAHNGTKDAGDIDGTTGASSSDPDKSKPPPAIGKDQVAKQKDLQIPLDEGCPFATSVVYIAPDGVIYDASLNQTNAGNNNNKFYRIQVLVDPKGTCRTWTRWGRVGERGQTAVASEGTLVDAIGQFEKKFRDKSGLPWNQRGDDPKPAKYAFVERNYEPESDDEEDVEEKVLGAKKKAPGWQPPKCTLQAAVQDLLKLIFNQQIFNNTMLAMNYDASKLPLGKLSKATITRGFQLLKDLSARIDAATPAGGYGVPYSPAVEQVSNSFYSLIPHNFGRSRPPVIANQQMVKKEIELLESLSDMKDAALIMKMEKVGDADVNPLDRQYQGLNMEEMTPLDAQTAEYLQLQDYLVNTRGETHNIKYNVESIFRIERQGERDRFDKSPFAEPAIAKNRRLLWHGSRSTNFGGILSQGLRIAPPEAPVSGYMFGKGIYLADMSSKSANYCCAGMSNNTALLLLCEAELGDPMQELIKASYNAGEDAKAKGMVSTWGKGSRGPLNWKDAACVHPSLAGVKMPDVSVAPGRTDVPGASLYYNEYICYDVAQRTASTCITCRARKVRCDGRRGICTNCERLGFACSYDENVAIEIVQPDNSLTAIAVPRRRARQACQNCHAKKARCSGSMPRCDRCRLQALECVYRPGKRALPLSSALAGSASQDVVMHDDESTDRGAVAYDQATFGSGTTSPAPAASELGLDPDEPLALRAFDNFFRHVHHMPMFSFLHRASLMERYHTGSLDRSLLLALVGITALLTDLGPGMVDYGDRCIEEAVAICLAELEKPSILRLQALVIAVKHRILSKRLSSAFMVHAVASRFATALRLNHENANLCFLARESRRRLMWSLYMIDSAISSGQPDVALWPDAERQIHVQLPCNERNFEFDLPEPTETLQPPLPGLDGVVPPLPDVLGFMALQVRIHWMRTRTLQRTMKAVAVLEPGDLAALPTDCARLAGELEAFEARLPLSFRWSEANLRLRTYSPRLGIFIMTHVWWRQCYLDLYRLFLTGLKEALPPAFLAHLNPESVARGRRQCYEHARAMADMFAQVLTLSNGAPVTDIDLPGCAFQCARVLYHGLQTAGDEQGFSAEGVQELATVCLRAAQNSTPGPACAGIQADIEELIAHGLQLAPGQPVSVARTRGVSGELAAPRFAPSTSGEVEAQIGAQPLAFPRSTNQAAGQSSMSAPAPVPALSSFQAMPVDAATVVAPSSASGGTSGTNAFEEVLDGLNFGSDLFGSESWPAFPSDWLNAGYFPPPAGGY